MHSIVEIMIMSLLGENPATCRYTKLGQDLSLSTFND